MNEEKYIVTIDGPDCTGKTYTWTNLQRKGVNVQIRGILSNIAYGLKYSRNIDEMIDMYNKNPLNYKIYLLVPQNQIKVERLYSRLKYLYSDDEIVKALNEAQATWKDKEYFDKAIEILTEKYKGKLEISKRAWQSDIDNLESAITDFINDNNTYSLAELRDLDNRDFGTIVLNEPIETFEKVAKDKSEFKYIVFNETLDKKSFIQRLYDRAKEEDSEYAHALDTLTELTDKSYEEVYDEIFDHTGNMDAYDAFKEYLDDYELEMEVYARIEVETTTNVRVKLSDYCAGYDCPEDYIYDDSDTIDEITSALEDEVRYAEFDRLEVNEVR